MANMMHQVVIRPPDKLPQVKIPGGPIVPAGRAKLLPIKIYTPKIGLNLGT